MHDIMGDCNWAEGCHCTVDGALPGCDKAANKEGPPTWVGALAFASLDGSDGDNRWDGLQALQLVKPGAYNLSAPALRASSAAASQQQHYWFAHREEPKLLWSWSEKRQQHVASHLFNVVEAGARTIVSCWLALRFVRNQWQPIQHVPNLTNHRAFVVLKPMRSVA